MNTKSSTSKRTLLHYLVETAEQKDPDALGFVDTLLEPLQKTSRSIDLDDFASINLTL